MSSSLPVTPTTPISYYRPPMMVPQGINQTSPSENLFAFLSSTVNPQDVEGALAEFFFRSLISGRRVREWCEDVDRVTRTLRDPAIIHTALHSPILSLAFPFSDTSHSHYPGGTASPLPPLVPPSILPTVSRKQLVDGLMRLSRRLAVPSLAVDGWQETVIELCLEYIGRRWQLALEKHETDILGGIGLKLLEVEFDLHLQGHPSTSRPLILPILQRVRFDLGLVTASQLVTRLNSPRHRIASSLPLFAAWLTTRLRAGESPQSLVDELVSVHDKLTNPSHKEEMITMVSSFGIRFDHSDETPQHTPHSKVLPSSPGRIARRFSLRNKAFGLTSPRWLTHRRHDSSSKFSGIFPSSFDPDRRPSLPNVSTTSLLHQVSRTKLSIGPQSPRAPATVGYSHSSHLQGLFSSPDLLASTLSLIDGSNLRPALVGQLLSMKYHISPDPSDDWYLGGGHVIAQRLITDIEDKLLSTQSAVDDITELRKIFGLPRETTEYPSELEHLLSGEFGGFPVPPTRLSMSSTVDARSQATSFDLDRYFEGISEAGNEDDPPQTERQSTEDDGRHSMDLLLPNPSRRSSAGAESLLTVATSKTGTTVKSRGRRSSSHTSFTIQKATRGWTGYPAQLVKPRRVLSLDERASGHTRDGQDDYVPLNEEEGDSDGESERDGSDIEEPDHIPALGSYLPLRSNRWSRSEADLIFPRPLASPDDSYTHLPTVNSLRRRKRMQKPSLSAIDLGLGRQVLTPPGFPQSPPPTEDDLATPIASSFAPATFQRCSTGPISFFSPLTAPLSPIRDAQALMPEGYVAPLTPPTSPPQAVLDLGPDTPRASTSSGQVGQGTQSHYLDWSPPWRTLGGNSSAPSSRGDEMTPRVKRQMNRQYRILDGDLSPEKKPSVAADGPTSLPVIREDPPSPRNTSTRTSPNDSPHSEDWFTAPETPRPWTGEVCVDPVKASSAEAPSPSVNRSLGLPAPPPRSSSLRRLKPSTSQNSLSGVTTWSLPSYNPHSPSATPAPLDIDDIASASNAVNLGSPFQRSARDQGQRSTSSPSWTSSDDSSSSIELSESVNSLKSILGLFLDPAERFTLHPNVTEGHIRYVLNEMLKREMDEDERGHIKWLITQATQLIHDPRWHRQVGPYLAIWNPSVPATPASTVDLATLPDLTPRNLNPPKSHPLLSPIPRPQPYTPSKLPWSASNPNLRRPSPALLGSSTSSSALNASTSTSSTLTGPEASLLGNNSGQAALFVRRRMNKFRLSISTFGRRDSFGSSSSPSSTKSQTLYEALQG